MTRPLRHDQSVECRHCDEPNNVPAGETIVTCIGCGEEVFLGIRKSPANRQDNWR